MWAFYSTTVSSRAIIFPLSYYPAPAPFPEKIVSYNKNEHMTNFRKESKYSFFFILIIIRYL